MRALDETVGLSNFVLVTSGWQDWARTRWLIPSLFMVLARSDSHGAVGIGSLGTDHPRWFGSFCAQGIFPSLVRQESRVGRKGLEGRGPIGVCLLSGVEIWLFFLTRSFLLACGSFCTSWVWYFVGALEGGSLEVEV